MNGERRGTVLAQAEDYANAGFRVVPLRSGSKIPALPAWQKRASSSVSTIRSWVGRYGNGSDLYGVSLAMGDYLLPGMRVFAIDCDRHDPAQDGVAFLQAWEREHGPLPDTLAQTTPHNGVHLLYWIDADHEQLPKMTGGSGAGVDWRHDNACICAAPTKIDGVPYRLMRKHGMELVPTDGTINSLAVAHADDRVRSFITAVEEVKAQAKVAARGQHVIALGGRPSGVATGEKFLRAAAHSVGTGSRNDYLMRYACSLRGQGTFQDGDEERFRSAVQAENLQACTTPLDIVEVNAIVDSVLRYPNGHDAQPLESYTDNYKVTTAASMAGSVTGPKGLSYFRDKDGQPSKLKKTITNVAKILEYDPRIAENVRTDRFTDQVWLLAPCIDEQEGTESLAAYPRVFSVDSDLPTVQVYLEHHGFESGIDRAFTLQAWTYFTHRPKRMFSPFERVLDELSARCMARHAGTGYEYSYDGGKTWAHEETATGTVLRSLFDAPNDELTRAEERLLFRGLAARAKFQAEAKVDYAWVLRGEQGIGKSTFCEMLALDADKMYTDVNRDLGARDTQMLWSGKLVAELGEGTSLSRSEVPIVRDMITRRVDEYRRPYGHDIVRVPRSCLFVVTANESDLLVDHTGNRRWLIIECGRRKNDMSELFFDGTAQRLVEKAWAEALADLKAEGKEKFLHSLVLPAKLRDLSEAVNAKHMAQGQDEITVADWLTDRSAAGSYQDARRDYLAGRISSAPTEPEPWHKGDVITVSTALREALNMRSDAGSKIRGAARRPLAGAIENSPYWKQLDGAGNVRHTDVLGVTSRERAWEYVGPENGGTPSPDYDDETPVSDDVQQDDGAVVSAAQEKVSDSLADFEHTLQEITLNPAADSYGGVIVRGVAWSRYSALHQLLALLAEDDQSCTGHSSEQYIAQRLLAALEEQCDDEVITIQLHAGNVRAYRDIVQRLAYDLLEDAEAVAETEAETHDAA